MPRAARRLGIGAVLVVALVVFVPWLTTERASPVSTAATPPLFSGLLPLELRPGEEACLRNVALDPAADVARVYVATFGRPGQPRAL